MTRVLVTGGGGFLGSHLVERLRADGHDVVVSRRRDYDLTRWDDADPVNLGSGEEISIRDLAELVAELTGFEGTITWDTSKPNGYPRRMLDTSRAAELFGFRAQTPLREGVERTVAWYRAHAPAYAAR